MIQKLTLTNFRNFTHKEFLFKDTKNIIIGENGNGKTNILEALALFSGYSLNSLDFDTLTHSNQNYFYIEATLSSSDIISISYDQKNKKKKYMVNKKPTTKAKFLQNTYTSVHFSPIVMNMMYLSPTLRREFLDNMLSHTDPTYSDLLKRYKTLVKNRNKMLRSIAEWKSQKKDISFWDAQFIELATSLYLSRFDVVEYINTHIHICNGFFWKTRKNTCFVYTTKVRRETIKKDISQYLTHNLDRDIIIWKTNIGPHVDDFEIYIDQQNLTSFASRWEVKSTIIALKYIEAAYIRQKTGCQPILLIDDLLSELDNNHRDYLLSHIWSYQAFITSIYETFNEKNIIQT